jgi:hypothetical protein
MFDQDVEGAKIELRRHSCCRDGLVEAVPSPKTAPGGHHAKSALASSIEVNNPNPRDAPVTRAIFSGT